MHFVLLLLLQPYAGGIIRVLHCSTCTHWNGLFFIVHYVIAESVKSQLVDVLVLIWSKVKDAACLSSPFFFRRLDERVCRINKVYLNQSQRKLALAFSPARRQWHSRTPFVEAVMDLNLGLCNVMLPLTPRTSVKAIAANINSACDILRRRSTKCQSCD